MQKEILNAMNSGCVLLQLFFSIDKQYNDMAERKQSSIKIQVMARGKLSRINKTKEALAPLERAEHTKTLLVATGLQARVPHLGKQSDLK